MRPRIAWASTQSDDARNWEEGEGAWLEFDFVNTSSSATYKTSETAKPPPRRHAPSMASQILVRDTGPDTGMADDADS
ncbi:hypothetical protein AAF712_007263 [Marasmius tenuissimus]|uniref:Uncharacterized protein n=1 Tax=Marasmius tenuissimus TaxID=585030 RepID=A0ABR2ZVR4_9AGAR